MDQRRVFDTKELPTILTNLQVQKKESAFLLDAEGLSRMEGVVASIEQTAPLSNTLITLQSGYQFTLSQVIAVNGIFRSDYSEC